MKFVEEGKWIIFMCFGIFIGISSIFFAIMSKKNKGKDPSKLSKKEMDTMDDETFINYVEEYLRIPDYNSTPLMKKTGKKLVKIAFVISFMITSFFRR